MIDAAKMVEAHDKALAQQEQAQARAQQEAQSPNDIAPGRVYVGQARQRVYVGESRAKSP